MRFMESFAKLKKLIFFIIMTGKKHSDQYHSECVSVSQKTNFQLLSLCQMLNDSLKQK